MGTIIQLMVKLIAGATLADVIRVSSHPQLLFCMGYGPEPWPTPRWPIEEISSLEG